MIVVVVDGRVVWRGPDLVEANRAADAAARSRSAHRIVIREISR